MKKRLAVVTTHPIQYNAPLFALLAERGNLDVKVFYTWGESVLKNKFDPGFEREISWDIPLLSGYNYSFEKNVSNEKGSHHFYGIDTPGLNKNLQDYDPHAILLYGWSFKSHLAVLRFFRGKVSLIFRGDSHLLDKFGLVRSLKRRLFLAWIYRAIDLALYTGQNNYDYYRWCGVPRKKLFFGPHAIDNRRFNRSGEECLAKSKIFRLMLKISEDAFVFLFAGKLESKKDPFTLIESFINARLGKEYFLVMVGNGPLERELKNIYESNSQLRFLDFQNQSVMPAIYRMADVFVLPSKGPNETWGLSVNEAMATGRPVIVSDKCGCAADLVKNGINGFIFNAGNKNELSSRLTEITKMDWETMSEASKKIVAGYDVSCLAAAVEESVLHILRDPGNEKPQLKCL